jgi:hypothetical protein
LEFIAGGASKTTAATVGDTPIVVFWKAGQSSALQISTVDGGRDIGSVGVFSPDLDGRAHSPFELKAASSPTIRLARSGI